MRGHFLKVLLLSVFYFMMVIIFLD